MKKPKKRLKCSTARTSKAERLSSMKLNLFQTVRQELAVSAEAEAEAEAEDLVAQDGITNPKNKNPAHNARDFCFAEQIIIVLLF